MTGKLGKKLGQFKQWTSERFGGAERTNAPDEFRRMDMETEARKRGVETLTIAIAEYTKTLDKRSTQNRQLTAMAMLAKAMTAHGRYHGDRSTYGIALMKIGEVQDAIQAHQAEFALALRNGLLLEATALAASMKEYSAMKRKLENRRLDYDAKQNRLSRSKKEKPALESEVTAAQTKYNETLADLQGLMAMYEEHEELLLEPLIEFAKAQHEYFAKGMREMADLHVFLTEDRLTEQIKENAANPERAEMRKAALGFAEHNVSDSGESSSALHKHDVSDASETSARGTIQPNRGTSHLSVGGPIAPVAVVPRNVSLQSLTDRRASKDEKGSIATASSPSDSKTKIAPDDGNEYVEAIYAFEASGLGEMTLAQGDIIRVLRRIDDGWWVGECPGQRSGMFPSNYVRAIPKAGTDASSVAEAASRISIGPKGSDNGSSRPAARMVMPQESTSTQAIATACSECGCNDYSANVFKVGHCNNCFHRH